MKKLMIAFAAVALATCAQAATVKWSSGSFTDINGVDFMNSSQFTKYTVEAKFWDSTGNTLLATSEGTFNKVEGVVATFDGQWGDADKSTTYYTQFYLTDKDGNTLTSEKASFSTTASSSRSINFATGNNFTTSGSKFTSDWVAAPEPTSGLLLLLGVAGLVLRRKQK